MKQVITIIYFTDNAGKARTIEFSLKSLGQRHKGGKCVCVFGRRESKETAL